MEPEKELHSFPFSETLNGVEHNYRITENGGRYGIERDGVVIAEIMHDSTWRQLSGDPLNDQLLDSIGDRIEAHYD